MSCTCQCGEFRSCVECRLYVSCRIAGRHRYRVHRISSVHARAVLAKVVPKRVAIFQIRLLALHVVISSYAIVAKSLRLFARDASEHRHLAGQRLCRWLIGCLCFDRLGYFGRFSLALLLCLFLGFSRVVGRRYFRWLKILKKAGQDFLQDVWCQGVVNELAALLARDKAGILQNCEVLRYRWLGHVKA